MLLRNKYRISGLILFIVFILSCENRPSLPTIRTATISEITYTAATSGGELINDGGAPVVARGVCWNTDAYPTINNSMTIDSCGSGSFVSTITHLTTGTTYFVRAYATNISGTGYGNQVLFMTNPASMPVIITKSVSSITETTATTGGEIIFDGSALISERGICWSTNQNPTINDNKTFDESNSEIFTSIITGLLSNTTYFARAYATNSVGIAYGNEISFTTVLAIGDTFQGGIVAYILQSGDPGYIVGETHGLITVPGTWYERARWGCEGTEISGADATGVGTGNQNTLDIMAGCSEPGIAARLCGDLVLNGYSDWYLPSNGELAVLYLNRAAIGGFAKDYYWSSTEVDNTYALLENFYTLNTWGDSRKHVYNRVRAVRSF